MWDFSVMVLIYIRLTQCANLMAGICALRGAMCQKEAATFLLKSSRLQEFSMTTTCRGGEGEIK